MEAELILSVIYKLVGSITPAADSGIDKDRLENMKKLCTIAHDLLAEINYIARHHKGSPYHSEKQIGLLADKFISETLGIGNLENL